MKRILAAALAALMLTGCGAKAPAEVTTVTTSATEPVVTATAAPAEISLESRFDTTTEILLSDELEVRWCHSPVSVS